MSKSADFDMDLNEAAQALTAYWRKMDSIMAYWGFDEEQSNDIELEVIRRTKEIY